MAMAAVDIAAYGSLMNYELPTVKYDFNKKNALFVLFFIMGDFVLFYCHCAVSLLKCYSVNMCHCHV